MVDPDGREWDADANTAKALIGVVPSPRSSQEFLEGLVGGKGYVGLYFSDRASYVYINPWNVTPAAMASASAKLIDRNDRLVITALHRQHWEYKLHATMASALDHIEQAILRARSSLSDRFRMRAVTPTQLANSSSASLCDIIRLAESYSGVADPALVAKVATLTDDRLMLCRWEPGTNAWIVHSGGLGYDRSHFYLPRDHLIDDQPDQDREYGCWLHERYREVAANDDPVAEKVDAIIRSNHDGMRRFTYHRILIPLTDLQGNRLLLTTSQRDRSIDLGVDARHEFARV